MRVLLADVAEAAKVGTDFLACVERHFAAISELMKICGLAIICGKELRLLGDCLPIDKLRNLVPELLGNLPEKITSVSNLEKLGFKNAKDNNIAGVMLIPLSFEPELNVIALFRTDEIKTIDWAGNPYEVIVESGLPSPRKSFSRWVEQVQGESLPWTRLDQRLGTDIQQTLLDCLTQKVIKDYIFRLEVLVEEKAQMFKMELAESADARRTVETLQKQMEFAFGLSHDLKMLLAAADLSSSSSTKTTTPV